MLLAVLITIITIAPLKVLAVSVQSPVLGQPKIINSTQIRWPFMNRAKNVVAFELWDTIGRRILKRVDDPKATYIDETNVVPADPDMACGRYIVAVAKTGLRSFGQTMTYPCVRTPPVVPPKPRVEILDKQIIKVTASSGDNDPATAIGIYEANRGAWVSPSQMFTADPELLTHGMWGADIGTTLIGLRPNSSYVFYAQAQSVTGELTKFSQPTAFRMPAEVGEAFAPTLLSIGNSGNLLGQSFAQTFKAKSQRPRITGFVNGSGVTVTLDDRPYAATLSGAGQVKNFSFVPKFDIGKGYHYLRLGALRNGEVAWSPTIEFVVE